MKMMKASRLHVRTVDAHCASNSWLAHLESNTLLYAYSWLLVGSIWIANTLADISHNRYIHVSLSMSFLSTKQSMLRVFVFTIAKFPSSGKMKWVCRFTRQKMRRKKWHIEMGVFHHPTFAIYLPWIAYCCRRFYRHRRYHCAHRCFNVWCGRKMCRHSYIHMAVDSVDGCHFASFSGTFSTSGFHYQGPWSQVHPCTN